MYAPLPATEAAWPWGCTDNDDRWDPSTHAEHLGPDDGNPLTGPLDVDWTGMGDAPPGAATDGCVAVAQRLGEPYSRETGTNDINQIDLPVFVYS